MFKRISTAAALVCALFSVSAVAQETRSAPDAKVYFVNLKDGDSVASPFLVKFGLSGMGIAPAGLEGPLTANTGHHHLVIDDELKGDALKQPVPLDETHLHFGKGQTEAMVKLAPGRHVLQIVLADWTHIPHNPPVVSERIAITVK